MNRIIFKTWVFGFYKIYAGFLFVLFLFFFGFLKGQEHLAIAQFLIYDIKNLIYPALANVLYGILLLFYGEHFLLNPKNRFLSDLIYLPGQKRLKLIWLGIHWLLLPVTIYDIFLFLVALLSGRMISAFLVFIFFIFLSMVLAFLFNRRLLRPVEKIYGFKWKISVILGGKWSITGFMIKHLILYRSFPFLLTKILTFLSLYLFTILIPTVDFLDRFLGIGVFVAVLSNGLIPYEMFHFSLRKMTLLRNLPIRRSLIFLQAWLTTLILLLPEIIYIFKNYLDFASPSFLIIHLLAAVSLLIFLFSCLLILSIDQEKFTIGIFLVMVIAVFYILFDLSVIFLLIIQLFTSYYLFYHYFYRYEPEYNLQNE